MQAFDSSIDPDPLAPANAQSTTQWLREAFDDHHRALLAYALRVTGGRHDWAEEAVQETYLRLCRQSPQVLEGRVRAWLFKVCRSRIIDMHRTHSTSNLTGCIEDNSCRSAPSDNGELIGQLQLLVESLPPRQRELLHLKVHGQLSYREIADATGLSVSNVGYLLHQAMQTLRMQFAAR